MIADLFIELDDYSSQNDIEDDDQKGNWISKNFTNKSVFIIFMTYSFTIFSLDTIDQDTCWKFTISFCNSLEVLWCFTPALQSGSEIWSLMILQQLIVIVVVQNSSYFPRIGLSWVHVFLDLPFIWYHLAIRIWKHEFCFVCNQGTFINKSASQKYTTANDGSYNHFSPPSHSNCCISILPNDVWRFTCLINIKFLA